MNEIIEFHTYTLISIKIRTDLNFSKFDACLSSQLKCFAVDSAVMHMAIKIINSISLMGK